MWYIEFEGRQIMDFVVKSRRSFDVTQLDDVLTYLKTGKTQHTYNGHPLFTVNSTAAEVAIDGIVYSAGDCGCLHPVSKRSFVSGMIVKSPNKSHKLLLINNADFDDSEDLAYGADSDQMVSMSFLCFYRMFSNDVIRGQISMVKEKELDLRAAELFVQRKMKILDVWGDSIVRAPATESPGLGYTWLRYRGYWHRSGTLLIQCRNKTYLFGADEGAYFGVELSEKVKTIKEAYKSLMPKEIRNKKGVLRQGEWFFVPVSVNELPAVDKCVAEFVNISLPRASEESNLHEVTGCEDGRIDQDGNIFFFNDGYVDIDHDEHEDLHFTKSGWYRVYKNTAVRSMSQTGVD